MSSYSELQKKYGNFSVPAYKITSDGKELVQSEFIIDEITVDNGMGKTAGGCRFSLSNVYERGSRQFSSSALSKLTPGSKISISLGYGSSLVEVFTGYIDELKLRFNEDEIKLAVFCLDARALMRTGAFFAAHKDKSIQDIAGIVLDKYAPLISAKDITLASLEKEVNLTQAGSDLDFIQQAAQLRGLYFSIDNGKAFISKANDKVCVEFDWEHFSMEFGIRYLDLKLQGKGYDHTKMEPISVEKTVKQKAKQASLLTVSQVVPLAAHYSGDAAKAVIEAKAGTALSEAISGAITCRGIPEPKLGQKIKINKFPFASLSTGDSFTVISIRHNLSAADGFYTEIGIEG